MPRLFLGIDLPDNIDRELELMQGGIPGARWQSGDKLHLTLRFIGDVDGGMAGRIEDAMERVDSPRFRMALQGVGVFPLRGRPRVLWAGVMPTEPVVALHEQIERALSPLGLESERRNYHPHVTLARLKNSPERKVASFVTGHALLSTQPFMVDRFSLYSSVLNPKGSRYVIESDFALADEADPDA